MKAKLLLLLLLLVFPQWVQDITKDKLIVLASLSYYKCDFDGDGVNDLSLWHPKTSTLYFRLSSDGKAYQKKFFSEDKIRYQPVFADYDGDEKTDFAFFQPESGHWIIFKTTSPKRPQKAFVGSIGDLPVPANIDGDKKYEITVWRPVNAGWLLTDKDEQGNEIQKVLFDGSFQDSVFAGDYDGDGKSDLINWRPDDGLWHIVKSGASFDFNQSEHIQHGKEWDIIVPNDYDADGKCDLVLWRPSEGTWYFKYAGKKEEHSIKFGSSGDIPLSGDINGDGEPELITWNQGKKTWSALNMRTMKYETFKWEVPVGCVPASTILQTFE